MNVETVPSGPLSGQRSARTPFPRDDVAGNRQPLSERANPMYSPAETAQSNTPSTLPPGMTPRAAGDALASLIERESAIPTLTEHPRVPPSPEDRWDTSEDATSVAAAYEAVFAAQEALKKLRGAVVPTDQQAEHQKALWLALEEERVAQLDLNRVREQIGIAAHKRGLSAEKIAELDANTVAIEDAQVLFDARKKDMTQQTPEDIAALADLREQLRQTASMNKPLDMNAGEKSMGDAEMQRLRDYAKRLAATRKTTIQP